MSILKRFSFLLAYSNDSLGIVYIIGCCEYLGYSYSFTADYLLLPYLIFSIIGFLLNIAYSIFLKL